MSPDSAPAFLRESWIYRNWKAFDAGLEERAAEELYLLSDARFTGQFESELGPYQLLNTIPTPHEPGTLVPALALRICLHLPDETESIIAAFRSGEVDNQAFTGGSNFDEIASLISLAHGVRVAVGPPIRSFHPRGDPRGSPRYEHDFPSLPEGQYTNVIPSLKRTVALRDDLLGRYPKLKWESALALARAARSYRLGIWIASADSNLCWLLLVSAVETAANEWNNRTRPARIPAKDLLRLLRRDYAEQLEQAAGDHAEAVLDVVGRNQNSVLNSQKKFLDFLLEFGRTPPSPRPEYDALEWSEAAMRSVLKIVYKYRSEALHSSKPFPTPMSYTPRKLSDANGESTYVERPNEATYHHGALWTSNQLPINLYAFHHIVLTALHKWWSELPRRTDHSGVAG